MWSPCNKFIAAITQGAIEIRDPVTLNVLSTLKLGPLDTIFKHGTTVQLGFSPDGCFLTHFWLSGFVMWDLQTGIPTSVTFSQEANVESLNFSFTYSMDGKVLVILHTAYFNKNPPALIAYNFPGMPTHPYPVPEGCRLTRIWTHGEFLRFATLKQGGITIWETEFTLTLPPKVVKSLPTPDRVLSGRRIGQWLFLPTLSRLAISLPGKEGFSPDMTLIWDAVDSKFLLNTPLAGEMSFSSDGNFFTSYCCKTQQVYVWKDSPTGYTLHQTIKVSSFNLQHVMPVLSPNGESVVVVHGGIMNLWHTTDPIIDSNPNPAISHSKFIMGFSPDESFVVFAHYLGTTITILDLRSGDPQSEIDAEMEVRALGVTKSTIIVVGRDIVTWNLDMGKSKGNTSDSIQIKPFPTGLTSVVNVAFSPDGSHFVTSTNLGIAIANVTTGYCAYGLHSEVTFFSYYIQDY